MESNNQNTVREMLRRKFSHMDNDSRQEITKKIYPSYEQARQEGNVRAMLAHKLNIPEMQAREEQREKEFASQDVVAWSQELKGLDSKIEAVKAKIENQKESLKAELTQERNIAERELLMSGVPRGSIRHIALVEQYNGKIKDIDSHTEIQSLKAEVRGLRLRGADLENYIEDYKSEHSDIINELRREQVKQNLKDAGLLDD